MQLKSSTYSTKEGTFVLPQMWRECLGEECLAGKISVTQRLTDLGIGSKYAKRLLQQDEEYLSWLNNHSQLEIANSKKRGIEIDGVRFYVPEDWKNILGEDCILKKTSIKSRAYKYHFKKTLLIKECRQNEEFRLWYDPLIERRLIISENGGLIKEDTAQKRKKTNIQRYGFECSLQNKGVKEKSKQTRLSKTGFPYANMKSQEEIIELFSRFSLFPEKTQTTLTVGKSIRCLCLRCGKSFDTHPYMGKEGMQLQVCPLCNQKATVFERELVAFIVSLGVEPTQHYRPDWLNGKEIDIFIESRNIGFEVNGALTHNSGFNPYGSKLKDKRYHANKSKLAEENGVRLYHIWEHWGLDRAKDIVRAKLGIFTAKLQARKLSVRISFESDLEEILMDKAHVLGSTTPMFSVSLLNGDEVVQTMQFKHESSKVLNLVRNVSCPGLSIIGGSQRIFSAAVKYIKCNLTDISHIVTYAIRDLTAFEKDAVYYRLGFVPRGDTGPTLMYYVSKNIRRAGRIIFHEGVYNRQTFMKYKLDFFNGAELKSDIFLFNPALSADENLAKLGIYPVYNSGCWKYVYTIK